MTVKNCTCGHSDAIHWRYDHDSDMVRNCAMSGCTCSTFEEVAP